MVTLILDENIGNFLKRDMYYAFEDFFKDYLESCDIDSKIGKIPIRVRCKVMYT